MKVKDLIQELQKQDQEKEVMIQQGEEYDYMKVYSVRQKDVVSEDYLTEEENIKNVVVIEYS